MVDNWCRWYGGGLVSTVTRHNDIHKAFGKQTNRCIQTGVPQRRCAGNYNNGQYGNAAICPMPLVASTHRPEINWRELTPCVSHNYMISWDFTGSTTIISILRLDDIYNIRWFSYDLLFWCLHHDCLIVEVTCSYFRSVICRLSLLSFWYQVPVD